MIQRLLLPVGEGDILEDDIHILRFLFLSGILFLLTGRHEKMRCPGEGSLDCLQLRPVADQSGEIVGNRPGEHVEGNPLLNSDIASLEQNDTKHHDDHDLRQSDQRIDTGNHALQLCHPHVGMEQLVGRSLSVFQFLLFIGIGLDQAQATHPLRQISRQSADPAVNARLGLVIHPPYYNHVDNLYGQKQKDGNHQPDIVG